MKQNRHYKKLRRLVRGGTTRLQKPVHLPAENSFGTAYSADYIHADEDGVLRMDRPKRLPTALAEASDSREDGLMPSGLVLTITFAAIIFIAIITWFVSQMPAK